MFDLIIDKNHDKSFGFGVNVYVHSHYYDGENFIDPWHFHLLITFAFWFVEFQVGRDVPKEKSK